MKSILKLFLVIAVFSAMSYMSFAKPSAVEIQDDISLELAIHESAQLMGEGTKAVPYSITSADEFNTFAKMVNSYNSIYADKSFVLAGNIDFSGKEMVPFGTKKYPFKGNFDGNGDRTNALFIIALPVYFR